MYQSLWNIVILSNLNNLKLCNKSILNYYLRNKLYLGMDQVNVLIIYEEIKNGI